MDLFRDILAAFGRGIDVGQHREEAGSRKVRQCQRYSELSTETTPDGMASCVGQGINPCFIVSSVPLRVSFTVANSGNLSSLIAQSPYCNPIVECLNISIPDLVTSLARYPQQCLRRYCSLPHLKRYSCLTRLRLTSGKTWQTRYTRSLRQPRGSRTDRSIICTMPFKQNKKIYMSTSSGSTSPLRSSFLFLLGPPLCPSATN